MSKIPVLLDAMELCRKANITLYIHGHRGLGKSSIVKQKAAAGRGETMKIKINGENVTVPLPMGVIDVRLAQCEASDLRGLPDKVDGRTVFLPPVDMPIGDMTAEEIETILQAIQDPEERRIKRAQMQNRYKHGILFLDELNRSGDDVLNAVFQLVLDRAIGQYQLPAGWQIVVAGNFMEGDYQTGGFTDAAFVDRFCHMTFSHGEPTMDEWMQYIASHHGGAASKIIEYTSSKVELLDGVVKGDLGFNVSPSRRSWESVIRIEDAAAELKIPRSSVREVIIGLIGQEAAAGYENYSCPVKPLELLERGVKHFAKELNELTRMQLTGVCWGVISFAKDKVQKDVKTANTCLDIAEFLLRSKRMDGRDIPVAFLRALQQGENAGITSAILTNPSLAAILSKSITNVFVNELTKRPELQALIMEVGWGKAAKAKKEAVEA